MPKKANNYITISYKVHLISVSENKYRKQRKPPENKSFQIYHIIHSSTRYYNHNTKGNQFHPFSSEINLEDKISCFCPPFWVSCHRKEWGKYSNNNTLPLRSQEQRHRQSRDPSPLPQYTRGRPSRPHPCIHPAEILRRWPDRHHEPTHHPRSQRGSLHCKLSCGFFMYISKFFLTFAVFVPAKPLHNAQIGGAFYYIYNL